MAATTRQTAVGIFTDLRLAQEAIEELHKAGFREDQIGVVSRDTEGASVQTAVPDEGTKAGEGAVGGMIAGAGVGGLWAIGIAAGLLPAIGPVIAGGVLASILASAAAGAAAGGLIGALIGLGIPEEEARYYAGEFQAGRTIVTVQAADRFAEATNILKRSGAELAPSGLASVASSTTPPQGTAATAGMSAGESPAMGGVRPHEEAVIERNPVPEAGVPDTDVGTTHAEHLRREERVEHRGDDAGTTPR
ncbi:MAG: hypothetical protein WD847_04970 [Pirellulales bacterium]